MKLEERVVTVTGSASGMTVSAVVASGRFGFGLPPIGGVTRRQNKTIDGIHVSAMRWKCTSQLGSWKAGVRCAANSNY
jgi:hypothetical protein